MKNKTLVEQYQSMIKQKSREVDMTLPILLQQKLKKVRIQSVLHS